MQDEEMRKEIWFITVIAHAVLMLVSCSTSSQPIVDSPSIEIGVFLQNDDEFIEMQQFEGEPEEGESGIPISQENKPSILIRLPDIDQDNLYMKPLGYGGTHMNFSVSFSNEALIITPKRALDPGIFCLVQGDPLENPFSLLTWCFEIDQSAKPEQVDSHNDGIKSTTDPYARQTEIAIAIVQITQAVNAATVVAAEQVVQDAYATMQAEATKTALTTKEALDNIELLAEQCKSQLKPKLENGDYSDLVPGVSLVGCDLSGLNLFGLDLSGADLRHANLNNTDLHNANLSNSDLRFATFWDANLEGAILTNADLRGALITEYSLGALDSRLLSNMIVVSQRPATFYEWVPTGDSIIAVNVNLDQINIIDVIEWKEHFQYPLERTNIGRIIDVEFSQRGFAIAYNTSDGEWIDVVLKDDTTLPSFESPVSRAGTTNIEWRPNKDELAVKGHGGALVIWNLYEIISDIPVRTSHVGYYTDDISWNYDGNLIAAIDNEQLAVIDIETGMKLYSVGEDISRLEWSPDGTKLATTNNFHDSTKIWDAMTGSELYTLEGGGYMSWSPDSKYLATGSTHEYVRIWNIEHGAIEYEANIKDITDIQWSPDGNKLVFGTNNGLTFIFPINVILQ